MSDQEDNPPPEQEEESEPTPASRRQIVDLSALAARGVFGAPAPAPAPAPAAADHSGAEGARGQNSSAPRIQQHIQQQQSPEVQYGEGQGPPLAPASAAAQAYMGGLYDRIFAQHAAAEFVKREQQAGEVKVGGRGAVRPDPTPDYVPPPDPRSARIDKEIDEVLAAIDDDVLQEELERRRKRRRASAPAPAPGRPPPRRDPDNDRGGPGGGPLGGGGAIPVSRQVVMQF